MVVGFKKKKLLKQIQEKVFGQRLIGLCSLPNIAHDNSLLLSTEAELTVTLLYEIHNKACDDVNEALQGAKWLTCIMNMIHDACS